MRSSHLCVSGGHSRTRLWNIWSRCETGDPGFMAASLKSGAFLLDQLHTPSFHFDARARSFAARLGLLGGGVECLIEGLGWHSTTGSLEGRTWR